MTVQIAIYGGGGFAREVAWLATQALPDCALVAFIDDNLETEDTDLVGIPVLSLEALRERHPGVRVALGIGDPRARARIADRVSASGLEFATLVHPNVEASSRISIGEGSVICAGSILTTDIRLGRGVQINLGCTIGHDVVLADFATLSPGVHISGCVQVGERAYFGTGAVVINGTASRPLVVGDDAVIGAGACVVRDVDPRTTVVGVPAKPRGSR